MNKYRIVETSKNKFVAQMLINTMFVDIWRDISVPVNSLALAEKVLDRALQSLYNKKYPIIHKEIEV